MSSRAKARRKAIQVAMKKQRKEEHLKKQNALNWVMNPYIVPCGSLAYREALISSAHSGPVIPYDPALTTVKKVRAEYFARMLLPDPRLPHAPQPKPQKQQQKGRPTFKPPVQKVATSIQPKVPKMGTAKIGKTTGKKAQDGASVVKSTKKRKKQPKEPEIIHPVRYKVELEEIPVTIGNEL